MLDTFRKHSNSSLIYLLFGALIFVFAVSFGPGSDGCTRAASLNGSTEFAARVNGDTISVRDYNRFYGNLFSYYQERSGGGLTPELAEQMGLKKSALDNLVNRALLAQEAQKRGIKIGDEELAHQIQQNPRFQTNGAFDGAQYKLFVDREMGTSVGSYEDELRKDMLSEKMLAVVQSSASATDDELKAQYDSSHNQADLSFVRFSTAQFMSQVKVAPTEAELNAYGASHATEIGDFYTRNAYRYHKPQRFQLRHILAKVAPDASEADVKAAQDKLDKARAELKAGKDFAEVAKTYSDDASTKDKGGEMGVFGPGSMDKNLEAAVSKLKAGENTEAVRTHFGFELAQVEKIVPAENKKLGDVKSDIALELLKNDAAKTLAKAKAEEALKSAQEGKKLAELFPAAAEPASGFDLSALTQVQVQDTGPFAAQNGFVPKIGPAPEISRAAFALTMEKPVAPQVLEQSGSYYVIQLKSREKPDEKDFEAHKDELREQVLAAKKQELVGAFVKALRESGQVQENQALTLPSKGEAPEGAS